MLLKLNQIKIENDLKKSPLYLNQLSQKKLLHFLKVTKTLYIGCWRYLKIIWTKSKLPDNVHFSINFETTRLSHNFSKLKNWIFDSLIFVLYLEIKVIWSKKSTSFPKSDNPLAIGFSIEDIPFCLAFIRPRKEENVNKWAKSVSGNGNGRYYRMRREEDNQRCPRPLRSEPRPGLTLWFIFIHPTNTILLLKNWLSNHTICSNFLQLCHALDLCF